MSSGCPPEGRGSSCVQESQWERHFHMERGPPVTDQGRDFWKQGTLECCVRPTRMCGPGIPGETEEAQAGCLCEGGLWRMWEVPGAVLSVKNDHLVRAEIKGTVVYSRLPRNISLQAVVPQRRVTLLFPGQGYDPGHRVESSTTWCCH